jgi:hypothetical protein
MQCNTAYTFIPRSDRRKSKILNLSLLLREVRKLDENQRNTNRINTRHSDGRMVDDAKPQVPDRDTYVGVLVIRGGRYRPGRSNFRRWK